MSPHKERRLLQAALALGCLSPFWFGLKGMIEGPAMLAGVEPGGKTCGTVAVVQALPRKR